MQSTLRGVIGILGFGVDGESVAEFLETMPEVKEVRVFDEKSDIRHQKAVTKGKSLDRVHLLFRSPGFPLTHPLLKEARERGIPVTSSTTYFLQNFSGKTVGVTGSNGKTTCTTLIAEMLRAEFGKENVEEGGNDRKPRLDLIASQFGRALLDQAKPEAAAKGEASGENARPHSRRAIPYVVLEMSSFQLMDCPVSPNVSVVLNITPNHLDWHVSMEEYAEAKRQIVANQQEGDIAILNPDDPIVKTFAKNLQSTVRWFDELSTVNCQLSKVHFKSHPSTIRAAVTAARALHVSEENIQKVLSTFRGVSHRLEFVRELDGVKWYNDSSCTTPESAITACEAFPEGSLILLLGGRDKGMDFTKLYQVIKERKVRVIPYGEMAANIAIHIPKNQLLQNSPFSILHSQFSQVVETARKKANAGDNVVLSPACASFDMFQNAKERGKIFEELVEAFS